LIFNLCHGALEYFCTISDIEAIILSEYFQHVQRVTFGQSVRLAA
jgi:hypothetical protein